MLIMPASLPFSITGTCDMSCSLIRLSVAPTERVASMVWGARVIIVSTLALPNSCITAAWIMFSSVTKPMSLFFSKSGSCLMPVWIMNFAILLRESSAVSWGAVLMRVLTFVIAGSCLVLRIERLVIMP